MCARKGERRLNIYFTISQLPNFLIPGVVADTYNPAIGRWRQEDISVFKASVGYRTRSCLKKTTKSFFATFVFFDYYLVTVLVGEVVLILNAVCVKG